MNARVLVIFNAEHLETPRKFLYRTVTTYENMRVPGEGRDVESNLESRHDFS
jgi:hypothetical protein